MCKIAWTVAAAITAATLSAPHAVDAQNDGLKIFISVDMEGIGGIGTGAMTSGGGKDYSTGRQLTTAEVNSVVAAIFNRDPGEDPRPPAGSP